MSELVSFIHKFFVSEMASAHRSAELVRLLKQLPGVEQVDINLEKKLVRVISPVISEVSVIVSKAATNGFRLAPVAIPHADESENPKRSTFETALTNLRVKVEGTTCHSCEILIERSWKKLPGVKKVKVNAASGQATLTCSGQTPSIKELQGALTSGQYRVRSLAEAGPTQLRSDATNRINKRPSLLRLVGLFGIVIIIGQLLSKLGLLHGSFVAGAGMSFGAIFVVGLVAASSSCIAVTGGLLLSAAAKFNERYQNVARSRRLYPVALFIGGRIIGYTLFGGLIGLLGKALAPSATTTGFITILAALYMFVMGLDMLGLSPAWLKQLFPKMPKSIGHRIMDAEGKAHPAMPVVLGAGTVFLPCGFTQALLLYALALGSFSGGALALLAFALGTAPALFLLGSAGSLLKGKARVSFYQFSGALVVVLGLWNVQNGLAVLGHPVSFSLGTPIVSSATTAQAGQPSGVMEGSTQVIKMVVDGIFQPSHFTLRAGTPVRWEVDGTKAAGCTQVLISRQLGIQKSLGQGTNTVEFTPKQSGEIAFSCSMGMVRGSFTVLP